MDPTLRALAAAAVLCAAAPIASADEGETAVSVTLGYATFAIPDHDPHGAALGVDYERGVTDALWIRGSAGGGAYYQDGPAYSGQATLGLSYALDVLQYVPYVHLGVGGIVVGGDQLDTAVEPLLAIGGGLDVLVDRGFSWGVQARFESFLDRTAFFTAGARITWRWGFF